MEKALILLLLLAGCTPKKPVLMCSPIPPFLTVEDTIVIERPWVPCKDMHLH